MCCSRGRNLVKSHHTVNRDIVADPNDETLATVSDDEIGVGNAATQRLGLHRRGPKVQICGPVAGIFIHTLSFIFGDISKIHLRTDGVVADQLKMLIRQSTLADSAF
jgi:hypothetical protein